MIPENLNELNELEVARLLSPLTINERRIIRMRFGLGGGMPATLGGVSEAIGIPREEVRQLELHAMEKLGWVNLV
jgi:DNA-directed RNA polymerase sigma subunit (sigma70/sigma32)